MPRTPSKPELLGTSWDFKMSGDERVPDDTTFHFHANNRASSQWTGGEWYKSWDWWSQVGNRLTIVIGRASATYRGELQGRTSKGTASNTDGLSWTFVARRVGIAALPPGKKLPATKSKRPKRLKASRRRGG